MSHRILSQRYVISSLPKRKNIGEPEYRYNFSPKSCGSVNGIQMSSAASSQGPAYPESDQLSVPGRFIPPVSRTNIGDFLQVPPFLGNIFRGDPLLVGYLKRIMPPKIFMSLEHNLENFAVKICNSIDIVGRECESNPPELTHFDAWGKRVDKLTTSHAWKSMHDFSAVEGIVAIPYEKEYGEWSRIVQAAKMFMYYPSSGLYSCPLAMTDGAAKLIQDLPCKHAVLTKAFNNLTSRNPLNFWTSGQWMTERKGGSDVANGTETVAVQTGEETYKLYGYKWFTSATDSEMAFTLARIVDDHGNIVQGSKGVSLFYLQTRNDAGELNNIEVQRLKNKLGTRQLPTAELLLDGADALLVSAPGSGVSGISPMLTVTRLHNSLAAASCMRRMIQYSRDYAAKRIAFKTRLMEYPLHMQILSKMEVECVGAFLFNMEIFRLLGCSECGKASEEEEHLIRFLTPILKLYTAKQAVNVASEGLESFGGQGYIEDTGLPTLYRDAQVLSIWEGTTNVLSLDVLRSIAKSRGKVLEVFVTDVEKKLTSVVKNEELLGSRDKLVAALSRLVKFMEIVSSKSEQYFQNAARDFSYSCARVYMGALIFEHASSVVGTERDAHVLKRWCMQDLTPVISSAEAGFYEPLWKDIDKEIVMSGYED